MMESHRVLRASSCNFDKKKSINFKQPISAKPERKNTIKNGSEMARLKIEENMVEKSLKSLMASFKHLEPHIVKEFQDIQSDLERKRLQEQQQLKGQAALIEKFLHNLQKEVTPENLAHLDLDKFKDNLMELEGKISVMKISLERQKKVLKNQENGYQESVHLMSQKVDEWAKPVKVSAAIANLRRNALSRSAGSCFNESINEYQKFLQERGGHTGGWDEADHLVYIRLLQKYQNKQTMFKHLHEEFPDKTLKDLCEHDQWYTEYEDLKAKQKEAIARWRENKNRSLRRTASFGDELSLDVLIKEPKKEIVVTNDYREKQKQELERWRNMKRLEMELKDLKNEEEQQKKLMVEEAKRIRHAIQKAELERYKEERIKKEVVRAQEVEAMKNIEAEERAVTANKALKTFRQRDAESLARQRLMKERLEKEQDAKEKMLDSLRQKVRVNAQRDPNRLFKPTGAWKERSKAKRDDEGGMSLRPAIPLNLKEVPRLGVPLWRRNH